MKFKEMKTKDIKELRYKLWIRNNKKCPVLNKEIPFEKTALDHAHKKVNEDYDIDKGVIRECLEFRVNAVAGKIENSIKRYGLDKDEDFDLPTFLRNLADYFERGAYVDEEGYMYIHPKEVKKQPKLSKRQYNKLKKAFTEKYPNKKFPEFPKSGKLTKKLDILFNEFNIEPFLNL
jgi:hypothetical protein